MYRQNPHQTRLGGIICAAELVSGVVADHCDCPELAGQRWTPSCLRFARYRAFTGYGTRPVLASREIGSSQIYESPSRQRHDRLDFHQDLGIGQSGDDDESARRGLSLEEFLA